VHDCTSKPAAMIKPAELRSPPHSPGSPADEDSRLLGSPAKASPTASADDTTAMSATSVLQLTLFTTVTFTVAQIIAGHLSNSVSLQGDSADMIVDSITYSLNLWVEQRKLKPHQANSWKTETIEIVVVLSSTVVLMIFTGFLFQNAWDRITHAAGDVKEKPMFVFVFSLLNLCIDVFQCWLYIRFIRIKRSSDDGATNINVLSAAM